MYTSLDPYQHSTHAESFNLDEQNQSLKLPAYPEYSSEEYSHYMVPTDAVYETLTVPFFWDLEESGMNGFSGFSYNDTLDATSTVKQSTSSLTLHDLHLNGPESVYSNGKVHPGSNASEEDLFTDEDVEWYKKITPRASKTKVIRDLSQYWYGNTDRRAREQAAHHMRHKMNTEEFNRVLDSFNDEEVLRKLTRKMKKKYGDNFKPTHCDLDENISAFTEASIDQTGNVISPSWYKKLRRKDKHLVIEKMSGIWYENSLDQKDRDLARYHIVRYFTLKDFMYVLQAKGTFEDDPVLAEIVKRTGGRKGRAHDVRKLANIDTTLDGYGNVVNYRTMPNWYDALASYKDKKYVITRMAFMYFGDFEDKTCRARARDYIIRNFTYEDFRTALDPSTSNEVMIELTKRTRPIWKEERHLEISEMKKSLWTNGFMSRRIVDKYVKQALEQEGYADKPVAEIEKHIVNKWNAYLSKYKKRPF